jgi:hypothetical protein
MLTNHKEHLNASVDDEQKTLKAQSTHQPEIIDSDPNKLHKRLSKIEHMLDGFMMKNLVVTDVVHKNDGQKHEHTNQHDLGLKEKCKELFEEWVKDFTGHGLTNIYWAKSHLLRILWLLSFSFCIAYSFYGVTNSIIKYYQYEKLVSTEYIRETPTDFPAVTICNLNPFDEYHADNFIRAITYNYSDFLPLCFANMPSFKPSLSNIVMVLSAMGVSYPKFCDSQHMYDLYDASLAIEYYKYAYYGAILNDTVWCRMPQDSLPSLIFSEFYWLMLAPWPQVGSDRNISMNNALDLLHWSNTGWLRFMANTDWINMTLNAWFDAYGIDGNGLIAYSFVGDCLPNLSTYDMQMVNRKIKTKLANMNRMHNASYYGTRFRMLDKLDFCWFNGKLCEKEINITYASCPSPDMFNCSVDVQYVNSDFSMFVNHEYGICYTFNDGKNTGPIQKTSQAGSDFGLGMVLKLGRYSSIDL